MTHDLPKYYYLRRLVACYERLGDEQSAADALLSYGETGDATEAADRFQRIGDMNAAGEAYLKANQTQKALECFQKATNGAGEVRCLRLLGMHGEAGVALLDQGLITEALPLLRQAVATISDSVEQARLTLHLARALLLHNDTEPAQRYARQGFALLQRLPTNVATAGAWEALGLWGEVANRQDRMQEGYAQALRLLKQAGEETRWQQARERYRAAAQAMGNRSLVRMLDEE